jgi:hypothetical protein
MEIRAAFLVFQDQRLNLLQISDCNRLHCQIENVLFLSINETRCADTHVPSFYYFIAVIIKLNICLYNTIICI